MIEHDRIRNGLTAANARHIRVAIGGDRMLVNDFGLSFATLRPQDIADVDFSGKVVEGNAPSGRFGKFPNSSIRRVV